MVLAAATTAVAQSTATLHGRVLDPLGGGLPGAAVSLEHVVRGYHASVHTADGGGFTIGNVPPQTYRLRVELDGFRTATRDVDLRAGVPVVLDIHLELSGQAELVTVVAEPPPLVDPQGTGSRTALSLDAIRRMPVSLGSRGLEAVLVAFPGFAQNANGAIHPRGAHNQMTYVVDGLAISDQLTGAFANSLDTGIVQTVDLVTGNVPAEFGSKVSAVAVVTTRSGLDVARTWAGEASLGVAGARTLQASMYAGGQRGGVGYFASLNAMRTERFLDPVSRDDLHNAGGFGRGYLRVDRVRARGDAFRVHAMGGRSAFELANLRSQHLAGQDQRQRLADAAVWIGYAASLGSSTALEAVVAARGAGARLQPSAFDTPVTAAQHRRSASLTGAVRVSRTAGRHAFRAGGDVQVVPIRERFSFAITASAFNDPSTPGFNDRLVAHDLTRGGAPFTFADARTGRQVSAFVQDHVTAGGVTMAAGLRVDRYDLLAHGAAIQPRVGVAWAIPSSSFVLRASYNRNYQTPPTENLLLSSSEAASRLAPASVRAAIGSGAVAIQPERQHVAEAGLQRAFGRHVGIDVSAYVKRSRDQQDNNNFFDTGIVFPTSLAAIDARGVEARVTVPGVRGWSGSASATMARAVSTPPFTGGLFLGQDAVDLLSAGRFRIDHDQALAAHATVNYTSSRGWWAGGAVRHDSGLVANASDPAEVAADTDYSDLLPYVNLSGDPPRVRPRTIVDLTGGIDLGARGGAGWSIQAQVSNVTNATALYNFQSVFVGTRLVAPRTASLRAKYRW